MILIPTILSGGAGSRLWPVSRDLHPKPFIRLADKQSLLQKAFLRAASLSSTQEILVITNRELLFKTEDEFNEVNTNHLPYSFILEPFGKNTAAAISTAALHIKNQHGENACLLVLPADHLVSNFSAFQDAVAEAYRCAQTGQLVTFGILPTTPETGYGYIEADIDLTKRPITQQSSKVIRFIEKPSLETAKHYLDSGRYLWNSGMFCFSVKTILQEMALHCPDILTTTEQCLAQAIRPMGNLAPQIQQSIYHLPEHLFQTVPENSIDYALLEHSKHVSVVPCQFDWSDVGSWNALAELIPADAQGNRKEGDVYFYESNDCFVHSPYRLTSTLGIKNLVVIDTPDALLVADKSDTQKVKQIYAHLKSQAHEAHRTHATVHRPWGTYTVLEEGPGFKIKRIVVNPGASLSLQMHQHRSEHWIVVSGTAKVVNGEQELLIKTNESTYIPAGNKHRLANPTQAPVVLIEVQSGTYLGEDDIVRFDDIYGRTEMAV